MTEQLSGLSEFERFRQIEEARLNWTRGPEMLEMDSSLSAVYGTPYGRSLAQYEEILGHNGAMKFLEAVPRDRPVIVDGGCGAGNALCEARRIFPKGKLIGIDVRDVRLNKVVYRDGAEQLVKDNFDYYDIEFHQDLLLNAPRIVSGGYDVLLGVGSFYDEPGVPYGEVLQELYGGLRRKGIVQLLCNPRDEKAYEQMMTGVKKARVPYEFVPANMQLLRGHTFRGIAGQTGTLTLGPKE